MTSASDDVSLEKLLGGNLPPVEPLPDHVWDAMLQVAVDPATPEIGGDLVPEMGDAVETTPDDIVLDLDEDPFGNDDDPDHPVLHHHDDDGSAFGGHDDTLSHPDLHDDSAGFGGHDSF